MQESLFGEPPLNAALSQWFTPPWMARRLAGWVPRGARILEPSCGRGSLIGGLLRAGHSPTNITGVDIDPAWAEQCKVDYPNVLVLCGDFLDERFQPLWRDAFDYIVMNPPFEDNTHMRFIARALELAPVVVGIFPVSIHFGRARDRELWAQQALVTRRALLPDRVDYGGDESPKFDTVALRIERRLAQRRAGEVLTLAEEVWTQ